MTVIELFENIYNDEYSESLILKFVINGATEQPVTLEAFTAEHSDKILFRINPTQQKRTLADIMVIMQDTAKEFEIFDSEQFEVIFELKTREGYRDVTDEEISETFENSSLLIGL